MNSAVLRRKIEELSLCIRELGTHCITLANNFPAKGKNTQKRNTIENTRAKEWIEAKKYWENVSINVWIAK